MFIDDSVFREIIKNSVLISIDLIIKNHQGQVLLGKRNNPPAKDCWFVPGGRIRKNETFDEAFKRLTLQELGKSFSLTDASFIAPYQHFYSDSVFSNSISTHYIALAYQLTVEQDVLTLPLEQHCEYRWFDVKEVLNNQQVHLFTKDYFRIHTEN